MTELLLDRAAAARRLTAEEVRSWGEGQRVFVSSVIDGYRDMREAVVEAIEEVGAEPVIFERFGGRDADPNQSYLDEVSSCDVYIGLLGARYGRLLPSRFSATHEEFRHAEGQGLRLAVWAQRDVDREGQQQSFLHDVQTFNVTGEFTGPADLTADVRRRLESIAAEEQSPWVKLGNLIFRANQIQIARDKAVLSATIKDAAIADALSSMDSQWGTRDRTFAWAKGVYDARVSRVESVSRTVRAQNFTVALALSEPRTQNAYTFGGMSYGEQTVQAIKASWFGEPVEGPDWMSGQFQITDPFAIIRELRPPAEALRPVAQLLITEILTLERDLGRITRFQLGSSVAGRRRLVLGWMTRSAHGQPGSTHQVDGTLELPDQREAHRSEPS